VNPVLILTRNNLHLTKRCVESVRHQDIETAVWCYDNGSTDGTREFLDEQTANGLRWNGSAKNKGVTYGWNYSLAEIWKWADYCLVIGNDTVLPSWMFSELLSYDVPFVTGLEVNWLAGIKKKQERRKLTPNPDFSCFLIRQSVWDVLGPLDDSMVSWASDCDYHVRGHKAGVGMYKAFCPYYHERSSTLNLAPPEERKALEEQANKDRAMFKAKWGCEPGTPEYAELFK
jgi:GT2 family glycosyltransferase